MGRLHWYVDHARDGSVIVNFRILSGFPFFLFVLFVLAVGPDRLT